MSLKFTTDSQPVETIIKLLERCEAAGQRSSNVFEDWISLVEATLNMMPIHAESIAKTGKMAEDPPEVSGLWARLRKRYNPESRFSFTLNGQKIKDAGYFDLFKMAFHVLINATFPLNEWRNLESKSIYGPDNLGAIYMLYAWPNPGTGQYFTPWNVAQLMAGMTVQDGEAEIHKRLKTAINNIDDPLAKALVDSVILTSTIVPEDQAVDYFHNRVLPALAPYADPILFNEPCIGSGIMALAIAAQYPAWAINWGLVRFTGQDIDNTCVQMARINFKLYGLDPVLLKSAIHLSQAEIRQLPEQIQPVYQEAKEAGLNGHNGRMKELAIELRENIGQYEQVGLFG